ncbi:MAG: hypothetical protein MR286_08595 [Clostridiales bacterium]|nr:hypothetical protein [Clostridiales bacterium]
MFHLILPLKKYWGRSAPARGTGLGGAPSNKKNLQEIPRNVKGFPGNAAAIVPQGENLLNRGKKRKFYLHFLRAADKMIGDLCKTGGPLECRIFGGILCSTNTCITGGNQKWI